LCGFASTAECAELLAFIEHHPNEVPYSTAAGILRLGNSFNDVRKAGNLAAEYAKSDSILEEALSINGVVARLFGCIAASWPHGLITLSYHGLPLHRSIARRITARSAEPHDDNLAKELPEDQTASTVKSQLGVNLYIEVPVEGGELEGWHRRLDREEYDSLRNSEPTLSYGVRKDAIGEPNWVLKPSNGDAIIFNNSELHAIRSSRGVRTTWGFFLGYTGDDKPLLIWS
jgi:hypothetical protein